MHSWESKQAGNAAEGIRHTDGIKSTDGSRRKCKEHNPDKNLSHAGSTSSAMWPEYFFSLSKRSTAAASVSLFLKSERSFGSNTLI